MSQVQCSASGLLSVKKNKKQTNNKNKCFWRKWPKQRCRGENRGEVGWSQRSEARVRVAKQSQQEEIKTPAALQDFWTCRAHQAASPACSPSVALGCCEDVWLHDEHQSRLKAEVHTLYVNRSDFPVLRPGCVQFLLTFLSNFSTSVACSILRSRSSFCISLIHATLLMYGLWLVLRSIPGSLSDFSISANRKSPPPRLPLSLSPVLSRSLRRFLEKFSLSRLLCLLSLEPMVLFFYRCRRRLCCSSDNITKRTSP